MFFAEVQVIDLPNHSISALLSSFEKITLLVAVKCHTRCLFYMIFATSWKDTHHIVLLAMIRDHLAGDRYPAAYPEYRDFSKARPV